MLAKGLNGTGARREQRCRGEVSGLFDGVAAGAQPVRATATGCAGRRAGDRAASAGAAVLLHPDRVPSDQRSRALADNVRLARGASVAGCAVGRYGQKATSTGSMSTFWPAHACAIEPPPATGPGEIPLTTQTAPDQRARHLTTLRAGRTTALASSDAKVLMVIDEILLAQTSSSADHSSPPLGHVSTRQWVEPHTGPNCEVIGGRSFTLSSIDQGTNAPAVRGGAERIM